MAMNSAEKVGVMGMGPISGYLLVWFALLPSSASLNGCRADRGGGKTDRLDSGSTSKDSGEDKDDTGFEYQFPWETVAWEDVEIPTVVIEGGTYLKGSPSDEVGRDSYIFDGISPPYVDPEVQYSVTLTHTIEVGIKEIDSRSLFAAGFEDYSRIRCDQCMGDCGSCPAEIWIFFDARWFANRLSEREGLTQCYECTDDLGGLPNHSCKMVEGPYECSGYRLPTDAEWEYIARAGSLTAFPWGSNLLPGSEESCSKTVRLDDDTFLVDKAAYCAENIGEAGTHNLFSYQSGSFSPNAWDIYDINGNVAEWVEDEWVEDPSEHGSETDPFYGSLSPGDSLGTVRGGASNCTPWMIRSAARFPVPYLSNTSEYISSTGFRLVRTLDPDN